MYKLLIIALVQFYTLIGFENYNNYGGLLSLSMLDRKIGRLPH